MFKVKGLGLQGLRIGSDRAWAEDLGFRVQGLDGLDG